MFFLWKKCFIFCFYFLSIYCTHFRLLNPIKPTCLNNRSITAHEPKLSPIFRANIETCKPIWHRRSIVLNAIKIIKYGVTDVLKFCFVATGTNGEMKNINRYTNDIPTGRYSAAKKITVIKKEHYNFKNKSSRLDKYLNKFHLLY